MANLLGKQYDELVRKIDSGIKNKWKWSWLEKTPYMLPLSVFIKKSSKPGEAHCVLCNATIEYGGKGASSLMTHCKTTGHIKVEKLKIENPPVVG